MTRRQDWIWYIFFQEKQTYSETGSRSPIEHYKRFVAIPLLDSLLLQMRERSNCEQDNVRALLCLVLTLVVRSDDDPMESVDGICCTGKPIFHFRSLYEVKWEGGSQYSKANTRKCKEARKREQECKKAIPNN